MKQRGVKRQEDRPSAVSHRATSRHKQLAGTPKPAGWHLQGSHRFVLSADLRFAAGSGGNLCAGVPRNDQRHGRRSERSGCAGSRIVVREAHTGAIDRTMSDSVGQYVVPFLPPGDYSITVTKLGFETLVRGGITLQAQEHPIINLTLTLGSESQTVTVTGEAPLLNQANASVGEVVSTEAVADLPLNGYAPVMLAELSVGVITTSPPGNTTAYDPGTLNSWSIGGTKTNEGEILLDGAADTQMSGGENGGGTFVPTEDSVQEVSVQTFGTDASIGHTIAGVINQVTKGGTNVLHGTAYEFSQFSDLAANLYFNDRNPVLPTPVSHYNQYGLSTGGPIWIPKVFNGKNKLFFFFAWEGITKSEPRVDHHHCADGRGEGGRLLRAAGRRIRLPAL